MSGVEPSRNIEPELFEATFKALTDAVNIGFGEIAYEKPDLEFVRLLNNSAKWFAARKTALQVLQLIALTKDEEKGTKRPFREFRKLAEGVLTNYNKTWLKTEYDTAIAAARSARDWQNFEAEADLYPNLEYMRTVSATPRQEHLAYVGIIRPINDPFWNTHLPPIAFNCKCSVRNTDAQPNDIPLDIDQTDPVAPALQNNPAKTGMLFNLPATAYAQETEFLPDETIAKELKTRVLPEMNFYIKAYEFPNGGTLDIHPAIDESEFSYNTKIGGFLASKGYKIKLEPMTYVDGIKNLDLLIDNIEADIKEPKNSIELRKGIQKGIANANKQGAKICVLYLNRDDVTIQQTIRGLRGGMIAQDGSPQNKTIEKVILIYKDRTIVEVTRAEITNFSFTKKLK